MEVSALLKKINNVVWGPCLLVLLLGTGIYLMIRMQFLPIRRLMYALKCAFGYEKEEDTKEKDTKEGEISPFSSLMTELAATIGTGNIVGVATAMVLGGPGALVWMILSAFLGLATKFAESMLSVKYRVKNEVGEWSGGPMYTLEKAFQRRGESLGRRSRGNLMRWLGHKLAVLYAVCAVSASFGMGNMTQANSIAQALWDTFEVSHALTGLLVTIATILVVLGGIGIISKVTIVLVPVMGIFYLMGAICVIFMNLEKLPEGIIMILKMAFSPEAVAGGVGGHITGSMQQALRWGVSRGVFSNEAGLGAAGISAAAAQTNNPVKQGYISMTGVFLDTIVICSITGLALISAGVLGMTDQNGTLLTGTTLTIAAFATVFGKSGAVFVSIGIVLFAFATIIGWAYQGEKAFEFLVKKTKYCIIYRFLYGFTSFIGSVCTLNTVWTFADISNGLMAIPNLICILVLSKEVICAIKSDNS